MRATQYKWPFISIWALPWRYEAKRVLYHKRQRTSDGEISRKCWFGSITLNAKSLPFPPFSTWHLEKNSEFSAILFYFILSLSWYLPETSQRTYFFFFLFSSFLDMERPCLFANKFLPWIFSKWQWASLLRCGGVLRSDSDAEWGRAKGKQIFLC